MKIHEFILISMSLLCLFEARLKASFTPIQNKLHQAIMNDSAKDAQQAIVSTVCKPATTPESAEWSLLKRVIGNDTASTRQAVQQLVSEGKNGNSPLLWATLLEKPNTAKVLLECGADIDADKIEYAISTNSTQIALTLIRGGIDISDNLDNCMYLCLQNTEAKDVKSTLELIQELINRGFDVSKIWEQCSDVYTAFNGKALELFLKNGAKQAKLSDGSYPLFEAIRLEAVEAIKILVNAGAEINRTISSYLFDRTLTALMLAIKQGHKDTVQMLLEAEADINQTCRIGLYGEQMTPLAFAISLNNTSMVKLLLANGAHEQATNNNQTIRKSNEYKIFTF